MGVFRFLIFVIVFLIAFLMHIYGEYEDVLKENMDLEVRIEELEEENQKLR